MPHVRSVPCGMMGPRPRPQATMGLDILSTLQEMEETELVSIPARAGG